MTRLHVAVQFDQLRIAELLVQQSPNLLRAKAVFKYTIASVPPCGAI